MQTPTQLTITIAHDTLQRLEQLSATRGISKDQLVEQALMMLLDMKQREFEPVTLTPAAIKKLHALIDAPAAEPTQALREYIAIARSLGAPDVKDF
jgi:hypothetical protein